MKDPPKLPPRPRLPSVPELVKRVQELEAKERKQDEAIAEITGQHDVPLEGWPDPPALSRPTSTPPARRWLERFIGKVVVGGAVKVSSLVFTVALTVAVTIYVTSLVKDCAAAHSPAK